MMQAPLTVIAGRGSFPRQLAAVVKSDGVPVSVAALKGFCQPDWLDDYPHIWFEMGQVEPVLSFLTSQNCTRIAMAGGVDRPRLTDLRLDATGAKFIAKTAWRTLGDNGLLTAVKSATADLGIQVVGVDELAQGLLMPAGALGEVLPSAVEFEAAAVGLAAAKTIGALDIGQAVVIAEGGVIAVEGFEGTEQLIARSARAGAILVKACKPGQSRALDLPSIGRETVEQLAAAGFAGAFVEAGASLLLDREATRDAANARGVFLYGLG